MASELEVGKITTGAGTGGDDPKVIVGGEGNAQLRARHIDGKGSTNSNTGKLFLNHYSTSDITMAVGGGNVGINTSSIEAGWSTSCAPIVEISGTKPTLILEEPSVGEFSFVTKNGNLYISDEQNNAARLTISSTGLAEFSGGIKSEKGILSGTVLIADDAVTTITPPRKGGFMKLLVDSATAEAGEYPQAAFSGEVFFDCGTSLQINKSTGISAISAQLEVTTSDVSGSSGNDNKVTIAVQSELSKLKTAAMAKKDLITFYTANDSYSTSNTRKSLVR